MNHKKSSSFFQLQITLFSCLACENSLSSQLKNLQIRILLMQLSNHFITYTFHLIISSIYTSFSYIYMFNIFIIKVSVVFYNIMLINKSISQPT